MLDPGVSPSNEALCDAMSLDESSLHLRSWAVRQALLGAFLVRPPDQHEWQGIEAVLSFLREAQTPELFERFFACAEALCPLESLAHLTDEARMELDTARLAFQRFVRDCGPTFPLKPGGERTLRILAGIALTQDAWLRDTGFVALSLAERSEILPESPAFGWHSFP